MLLFLCKALIVLNIREEYIYQAMVRKVCFSLNVTTTLVHEIKDFPETRYSSIKYELDLPAIQNWQMERVLKRVRICYLFAFFSIETRLYFQDWLLSHVV